MSRAGFVVVDHVSEPSLEATVNEDALGFTDAAAWVVDGGTTALKPLVDPVSDARWHSHELSRQLALNLTDLDAGPEVALRRAIGAISDEVSESYANAMPPSSSVGILATASSRDYCRYAILGDINVVYRDPLQQGWLAVGRIGRSPAETRLIDEYAKLRAAGISRIVAQERLIGRVDERRRRRMNRPDGYWIASVDERAADHAVVGELRCGPGARFLIISDGFAAAYDTYDVLDEGGWASVLDGGLSLAGVVDRIRSAERRDYDCIAFPRLKPSDDASAVLVEVR